LHIRRRVTASHSSLVSFKVLVEGDYSWHYCYTTMA
jgi:hypothetical protein